MSCRASLGLKAAYQLPARHSRSFFGQVHGLDRNVPSDDRIMRAVDHTHGAAAQFLAEFVTPCLCYGGHDGLTLGRKK